jgi:hypothetical protein
MRSNNAVNLVLPRLLYCRGLAPPVGPAMMGLARGPQDEPATTVGGTPAGKLRGQIGQRMMARAAQVQSGLPAASGPGQSPGSIVNRGVDRNAGGCWQSEICRQRLEPTADARHAPGGGPKTTSAHHPASRRQVPSRRIEVNAEIAQGSGEKTDPPVKTPRAHPAPDG